jgi:hypothetical protein
MKNNKLKPMKYSKVQKNTTRGRWVFYETKDE